MQTTGHGALARGAADATDGGQMDDGTMDGGTMEGGPAEAGPRTRAGAGAARGPIGRWVREAGEALAVAAAWMALSLACALGLDGAGGAAVAAAPAYPGPVASAASQGRPLPAASVWLVDGYNVLHAGLLHRHDRGRYFWSAAHRERLRARAACFRPAAEEVWLVFDGGDEREDREDRSGRAALHTVFAASADDWLVARVKAAERPEHLAVVTGDRRVAGRARHRGAHVVSPRVFLEHCDPAEHG